ncbi:MAG: hypothetical protein ACFB2Z_11110 [Maricaulaceae bacterium]
MPNQPSDPFNDAAQMTAQVHERLDAIEAWARDQRLRIAQLVNDQREIWLNAARDKIALERMNPSLDLAPDMPQRSIEEVAQERVSLKIQGMMADVEKERERRIETVTDLPRATVANAPGGADTKPKRERAHPLKRDAHAVLNRTQKVRKRAEIHFSRMRKHFIADAEAKGSETPVKDVYQNKNQRMVRIDKAEHRLLDKAFKRHGVDRAPSDGAPSRSGPSEIE